MTVRDGFTLDAAEGPAAREALLRYAEVTADDELAAALRQWVASERRERQEVRADGGRDMPECEIPGCERPQEFESDEARCIMCSLSWFFKWTPLAEFGPIQQDDPDLMTDGGQAVIDPSGRVTKPPAPHLTGSRPAAACNTHDATKPREWWCQDCNRRVTRAADGEGEFGHDPECEHWFQRSGGA